MSVYQEPPIAEWGGLLRSYRMADFPIAQHELRTQIRTAVLELARTYTHSLTTVASQCDIRLSSLELPPAMNHLSPVVMSGHQPVIYHHGLQFKEDCLSGFSQQATAIGVHVVIDTDEGDAGGFFYPVKAEVPGGVRRRYASLAGSAGLYLGQKLAQKETLLRVLSELNQSSRQFGYDDNVNIEKACHVYERLAGENIAVANSIVRWSLYGRRFLEVPLSHILLIPAVQELLQSWMKSPAALAHSYNTVLNRFRQERKIKNAANPFPNMNVSEASIELPFWIVQQNHGSRRACMITSSNGVELQEDEFLAPRGSITTLLLRGYCCDLFIHGRGGAKYDPFVEQFAREHLSMELAPFVVASADSLLFKKEYEDIEKANHLKDQYKEIVSHTDTFLDSGFFSKDVDLLLRPLVARRSSQLQELKAAADPNSRSVAAHALNAINKEVRTVLDEYVFKEPLKLLAFPDETLEAWVARDYPAFMVK